MLWFVLIGTAFLVSVLLAWGFYRRYMPYTKGISEPYDRLTAQIEIFKVAGEIIGATAIGLGVALSLLQFAETREQFRKTLAEQQEELRLSRQALDLSRGSQKLEDYQRALANLASDDETIRTAGVLALDELGGAPDSTYRRSARQLAVAFLRRRATEQAFKARPFNDTWPPSDVSAALFALLHLYTPEERQTLSLGRAHFSNGRMADTDLSDLNLTGARFDKADLRRAILRGARLHNASFVSANLEGASLSSAHLENANMQGANLLGADLVGASLDGVRLDKGSLSSANLTGATLNGARLHETRLVGTKLQDANLTAADLSAAQFLTQPQVDAARGDRTTKLPPTLRRPERWLSITATASVEQNQKGDRK